MWLFTTHGFFSVTTSPVEPGMMQIRARCRHDLEAMTEAAGMTLRIVETPPPADYRFRVIVTREELEHITVEEVRAIDYGNFKSAVHDTPGQENKSGPYLRVWAAMMAVQQQAHHEPEPEPFPRDLFTSAAESPSMFDQCGLCGCQHHEHAAGNPAKGLPRYACPMEGGGYSQVDSFTPAAKPKVDPLHNPKARKPRKKSAARKALDTATGRVD